MALFDLIMLILVVKFMNAQKYCYGNDCIDEVSKVIYLFVDIF